MKENSIKNERSSMEETIKTIEKMIKSYKEADKCGLSNNDFKNEIKALEHILSDYRRLLKENETLKKEKEQAWEEWNNLEQGSYETEQKLKQQIKELQKENEELKNNGVIDENGFEFAVDCDWDRLKRLIDTADKSNVKNQTIEALEELFGEEE